MPRKAREKSTLNIYHVMMRGINRQSIFEQPADFDYFERLLQEVTHPTQKDMNSPSIIACEIYAYALMDNHLHLLIKPLDRTLGETVKSLSAAYVYYFNHRYDRVGHLFQERFKSEPVEDDSYFITLLRYIHQNPVKAGMVTNPEMYPYSSWHEYLGNTWTQICNTKVPLEKITLDELKMQLNQTVEEKKIGLLQRKRGGAMPDRKITDVLAQKGGDPSLFASLPKKERETVLMDLLREGAGISQLSRLTGINKMAISRLKRKIG